MGWVWGSQYGFDQLTKIINRPRDEAAEREREAARDDKRQLELPFGPVIHKFDPAKNPIRYSGIGRGAPTTK
jgi:hypothetical protein